MTVEQLAANRMRSTAGFVILEEAGRLANEREYSLDPEG